MAGVEKFQRWRGQPGAHFMKRRPFDFTVVFETLKFRRDIVHLVVRVKRIIADARLVPLPRHHVHGIVQYTLYNEIAQLCHQHMGLGEMPQRHRQRADMVVMAMRNRNGVHLRVSGLVQQGQAGAAFAFRVHSGIKQNTVFIHLHKPPARANVGIGIQIGDLHKNLCWLAESWFGVFITNCASCPSSSDFDAAAFVLHCKKGWLAEPKLGALTGYWTMIESAFTAFRRDSLRSPLRSERRLVGPAGFEPATKRL